MRNRWRWLLLAVCLGAGPLCAAEGGDEEVTMTVIENPESAREWEFVQDIELPEPARGEAPGQAIAEEAREGRGFGQERADQARQQGNAAERRRAEQARERSRDRGQRGRPGAPQDPRQ